MKRRLIIVGAGIAFMTIGALALSTVSAVSRSTTQQPVSLGALEVRVIKLNLEGNIRLVGADTGMVKGARNVRSGFREPSFSETIDGDTLTIRSNCSATFDSFCNVEYSLTVPRDVRVIGTSSGGDITIQGIVGNIDVRSNGGDIEVTVAKADSITTTSSGGDVRIIEATADSITATSSGGDVEVDVTTAPRSINASSSGGDVEVRVPKTNNGYRVSADSSGGDTKVEVKNDPEAVPTIDAESSGGDVRVSYRTIR
jgi:hypothetical protein